MSRRLVSRWRIQLIVMLVLSFPKIVCWNELLIVDLVVQRQARLTIRDVVQPKENLVSGKIVPLESGST